MARQLRLEHRSTVYDLTNRGNTREALLLQENRARLLESLGNAIERQTEVFCGLLRSNYPCDREAGA